MSSSEEEKMERGVEGGMARIKLYSKLKKIEKDKGGLADGGNISPCLRKLRSKTDGVVRV